MANEKILSQTQLSYFWNKCKTYISGLLQNKSDVGHSHAISDISDLQTALNNRLVKSSAVGTSTDTEFGTISEWAWYDAGKKMTGFYQVVDKVCHVRVLVGIKGGWGDLYYSLPFAFDPAYKDVTMYANDCNGNRVGFLLSDKTMEGKATNTTLKFINATPGQYLIEGDLDLTFMYKIAN